MESNGASTSSVARRSPSRRRPPSPFTTRGGIILNVPAPGETCCGAGVESAVPPDHEGVSSGQCTLRSLPLRAGDFSASCSRRCRSRSYHQDRIWRPTARPLHPHVLHGSLCPRLQAIRLARSSLRMAPSVRTATVPRRASRRGRAAWMLSSNRSAPPSRPCMRTSLKRTPCSPSRALPRMLRRPWSLAPRRQIRISPFISIISAPIDTVFCRRIAVEPLRGGAAGGMRRI